MWKLKGNPYGAQVEALNRVKHRPHGYAFFMEMGLGKTAVTIAEYADLKQEGLVDKLIVFCPPSLKVNWAEEVVDWTKDTNFPLTVQVWPWKELDKEADVYVLNYESLSGGSRKGGTFVEEMVQNKRVMVSLDESTQIKNPQSVRTKSLLSLARQATFTRVLSGAPMVQGPQDVWAQLKFIGAFYKVNYYQFRNRYCRMGGHMGKQVVGPNKEKIGELIDTLNENAFRAKKKDWLDIPDKVYFQRHVGMTKEQEKVYSSMLKDFLVCLDNEVVEAHMVVTQMNKLQQISSNFVYNESGEAIPVGTKDNKLLEIEQILSEIEGKAIVVTTFKHSTDKLLSALNDYGCVAIRGGMKDEEITEAKRQFNQGEAKVIICQASAAKYGHTLLGTESEPCHTTIMYENSYSLDDRLQIEDRNHRIGQRFDVNIIDLVTSEAEKKVITALQKKQDVAEAIIDAIRSTSL